MQRARRREFTDQMKASAFTGWQINSTIQAAFGSNSQESFLEYSEKLGLLNEHEKEFLQISKQLKKAENKRKAKEAIDAAQKIVELDTHRKR